MSNGGQATNAFRRTPAKIIFAGLILVSVNADAQRADLRRFEAASIKVNNNPQVPLRLMIGPANRVYAARVDLRQVIWTAYGVDRLQVVGGPHWIDTARFDIDAVAPMGITERGALLTMLQRLLEDRFALNIRRERRELPVYELVMADRRRTVANGLKPSSVDCAALAAAGPPPSREPRLLTADEISQSFCGTRFEGGPGIPDLTVNFGARTLGQIAVSLRRYAGRFVIDRTELKGSFDAKLSFVEDPLNPAGSTNQGAAPSLFRALEEQLGLKLVSSRSAVDVLVVDHVHMPTEN
jgi:uncharacterized protein (TIGR03435 family)